jgi:hypothetical protein
MAPHHGQEIGKRLKALAVVCSHPYIEMRVILQDPLDISYPRLGELQVVGEMSFRNRPVRGAGGTDIVRRIRHHQIRSFALHDPAEILRQGCIQNAHPMPRHRVLPDFPIAQPAVPEESFAVSAFGLFHPVER